METTGDKRILLVDDDETILYLMRVFFKRLGNCNIDFTPDGHEGLSLIRQYSYDLVLLDIMFPDINGNMNLKHLRRSPKNAETPVVMVSSLSRPEEVKEAMTNGANAYIIKPFTFNTIKDKVVSFLS